MHPVDRETLPKGSYMGIGMDNGVAIEAALHEVVIAIGFALISVLAVIYAWGQICTIPGSFPADWISGCSPCTGCPDPPIQVHQFNANTYILRQSKCTNFEAPFMYLLFGGDKGSVPSRPEVLDADGDELREARR